MTDTVCGPAGAGAAFGVDDAIDDGGAGAGSAGPLDIVVEDGDVD